MVVVFALALLGAVLRACLRRIAAALLDGPSPERGALLGAALTVVALFIGDRVAGIASLPFSIPVLGLGAAVRADRQFLVAGASWQNALARAPGICRPLPLDPARRPDVSLVFIESYGEIAFSRAVIAQRLVASRAELAAAIERSGRGVVSALCAFADLRRQLVARACRSAERRGSSRR